ncbi:hypothetical protein JAAARDRAFT_491731 [Jaapia argillacea MUCL 33604]|uniref:Uncharacterized protein n=1 Tax=Jaapia argillacea MUCL 33604 TaxID=933084 RepID=A0A067PEC1_9AGAM|nr:hypothetical protein JAAARDRAFT_491731 [Jaapia argillacea MUCL 33604]
MRQWKNRNIYLVVQEYHHESQQRINKTRKSLVCSPLIPPSSWKVTGALLHLDPVSKRYPLAQTSPMPLFGSTNSNWDLSAIHVVESKPHVTLVSTTGAQEMVNRDGSGPHNHRLSPLASYSCSPDVTTTPSCVAIVGGTFEGAVEFKVP